MINLRRKDRVLHVAGIVCLLCVLLMIAALIWSANREPERGEFVPPPFDSAAVQGTPEVSEKLGWSEIAQDGLDFRAYLCGMPTVQDGRLVVYLTNPDDNNIWMKVRIIDAGGNTIGESGLIKPGEYVRDVELWQIPLAGANVRMKIMTYEQETYYSAGAVSLNTVITIEQGSV